MHPDLVPLTAPEGIDRVEAELGTPPALGAPTPSGPGELLVVTGMSGAGKTGAAKALQDRGWYVVDNLPPRLIAPLAGMMSGGGGIQHLAVVVDVRARQYFETLVAALEALKAAGQAHRVVFLDASDAALVKRFESSRRPHPLQGDGTILAGIERERDVLEAMRLRADAVLDTSTLSARDFPEALDQTIGIGGLSALTVSFMSFGFKHGLPLDANHVVDVRFLTNPFWIDELRHMTGVDRPVRDFVLGLPDAAAFIDRYVEVLRLALVGYVREHKLHLTVAIGCTGGRHRSVAIAEALAEALRPDAITRVHHRDLARA